MITYDATTRAALAAAGRDWPVFPLYSRSKRPAVRAWERRATTDVDQIVAWWTGAPYNIGIACGAANLVVLDLDTHDRERTLTPLDVRDGLARLAMSAGQPTPENTYTVETPSGGRHLYYLAPVGERLRNTVGLLGPGIDTRAAGGYVVAVGSVRRMHGRPMPYRVVRDVDVAPLPDWLAEALTQRAPDPPVPQAISAGRVSAYVAAALDGETRAVTAAPPGTRNHRLFRAAASLGELVGAGVLDAATATDALLVAARAHVGIAGFTDAEAVRTVASGLARGQRHPRRVTG